ncbi:MAG: metallophosphoesterase, partial [Patescibacteria group bacterium]
PLLFLLILASSVILESWLEMKVSRILESHTTSFRLGFTSDWEYRRNSQMGAKLTGKAEDELRKSVIYFNNSFRPNIVVAGGDFIESSNVKSERAKEELEQMISIFREVEAPKLYALGNHDLRSLTKPEVLEVIGIPEAHVWSDDFPPFRLVVLDTNFNKEDGSDRGAKSYTEGFVSQEELAWLKSSLATNRPVLLFSHHSPIPSSKQGRLSTNILNGPDVQKIIEESGNVLAVISGHTPESYHKNVAGVNYFVADTLVNELALGSFATVEISYNDLLKTASLSFVQHGQDKRNYSVSWKKSSTDKKLWLLRFLNSKIQN